MNSFPIFLASNNTYAPLLATAMMSIAENTSGSIAFHILGDKISARAMRALHRLAARYGVPLKFDSVDLSLFQNCTTGWFKTPITYARYLISDMFPEYDRALYVDADMIFMADVLDIPKLAPQDALLAACNDMGIANFVNAEKHKTTLGISPHHTYFNAGLLLINCARWRKDRVAAALLDIAETKSRILKCPSQDPLNIYFSPNRYFLLPQKFNYMPSFGSSHCRPAEQPFVIHFTERKPWGHPHDPYADVYWKYAMRTPFLLENVTQLFLTKASAMKAAAKRVGSSFRASNNRE